MTAAELVERVRDAGGRTHRMQAPGRVFVLTRDPRLAEKLQALGGATFNPPGDRAIETSPPGGYRLAKNGAVEWDIWINGIPVDADENALHPEWAVWEAAG